jgi:hypothetical protein
MIILILDCVLDGWRRDFAATCCRLAQMSSNPKIPMMFKTHEVARKKHKPNVKGTLSIDFYYLYNAIKANFLYSTTNSMYHSL